MRILLGLAILVTLALAASSRRFWSLRRTPLGAALTTGGWILVAIGFAVGPNGAGLVDPGDPTQRKAIQPLVFFLLSWVGLLVGLGADRRLPTLVPWPVFRLTLIDGLLSLFVVALAFVLAGEVVGHGSQWKSLLPMALVVGTGAMGWSAEVRSLRGRDALAGDTPVTKIIRAAAGLASILAVVTYGLLSPAAFIDPIVSGGGYMMSLMTAILVGLTGGIMGLWLMSLAGRSQAEFLVVLIGLVNLVAGLAATLGASAIWVAMLSGFVIVNLPGKSLHKFRRVILEAEQPVAMGLMLIAGMLADPAVGRVGALTVGVLVLMRAALKLGVVRRRARRAADVDEPQPALVGLIRQSPLAIALAVAYVAASDFGGQTPSDDPLLPTAEQVLTMVILVGLSAEAWPFLARAVMRSGEQSGSGGATS